MLDPTLRFLFSNRPVGPDPKCAYRHQSVWSGSNGVGGIGHGLLYRRKVVGRPAGYTYQSQVEARPRPRHRTSDHPVHARHHHDTIERDQPDAARPSDTHRPNRTFGIAALFGAVKRFWVKITRDGGHQSVEAGVEVTIGNTFTEQMHAYRKQALQDRRASERRQRTMTRDLATLMEQDTFP